MTNARLCFGAAAMSGFIAMSAATPISTTRFHFDSAGCIVLPVRVDGTLRTFVMDTGARATIVSPALATTLTRRIRQDRHGVRVVDDVSLELLGVVLPHQALRLSNEPILGDGVVGAKICDRFVVEIDFRARRITLWARSVAVDTRHGVVVPADFSNEAPVIKASISAAGVKPSAATLIVGLLPDTVSFTYRYAAEAGLLDAARNGQLPIEVRGVTKSSLSVVTHLPRQPERHVSMIADGIVSARALTRSWIVFDSSRGRIVIGR
ncbi:MAG TPA: hypothetical protein VFX12_11215 [Vicinamibacterales bacterium]|nr:hypothetical protein [Vicinamibacterales bacterium]